MKEKFVAVSGAPETPDESQINARANRSRRARLRGARSRLAARGPLGLRAIARENRKLVALTWLGLAFLALYSLTIGLALFEPGYSLLDRISSAFLLFGLLFIAVHGVGYSGSILKALRLYRETRSRFFLPANAPKVACIVASFNEPPDVLEETVSSLLTLDYANKEIVILDDSTKETSRESAREIAQRYGVSCVQRTSRRGYKAGAINDFLEQTDAPFVAIFDADALPVPQFLKECVPVLAEREELAFLQTPQFYANGNQSYVALASARQQNVFYEYIMEGKSVSGAAFCCGTNVIFRRDALLDVGGFNEKFVTEDFATSLTMHLKGWKSLYFNRVFVYSLAPENLAAYFTQQGRWSLGTLGVLTHVARQFLKNPRAMSFGQWWEYFLSTTYYLVGIVNLIFLTLPLLYIFFGIKPLRQDVWTYLAAFVPYFAFTLNMFYSGMEARGYKMGHMILGQQIGFISFPIHVSSAISAFLGKKKPFGVTPKGVGGRIPWPALWVQLLFLVLSAVAFGWGIYRYAAGLDRNTTAILVNSFWALYHVWMLASVFKLNQPVREGSANKIFFEDQNDEARPRELSALEGARNPLSVRRVGAFVGLATVGVVAFVGATVWSWNSAPKYPVNLYLIDRTGGPNGQESRALFWTLDFLKVEKQKSFGPLGGGNRSNYDAARDTFGFVSDPRAKAVPDKENGGDLLKIGLDRALPSRLSTPGALYLIDTYGEFVEFDAKSGKYVRNRAARRGLSADEIAKIETFSRRGGLLIGEWNTLSYPTRPGNYLSPAQMERVLETLRTRLERLRNLELPRAGRVLARAENSGDFRAMRTARGAVEDVRGRITDTEFALRGAQGAQLYNAIQSRQAQAAQRLEELLHVSYRGWYGRFVEDFAQEKQYDFRLWKNVRDYLTKKNGGRETLPSGPGFVFYPDGPSQIVNTQTGALENSPLAPPVAILAEELGVGALGANALGANLNDVARIVKSGDAKLAGEPLLQNVAASVPARLWFDVVAPREGARVLANYELKISPEAVEKLRAAKFPTQFLEKDVVRFPALVARRDGDLNDGRLCSLYFAGDASDYPEIPDVARQFPALGGVDRALSGQFGSFSSQFFWGFYEPVLRGALADSPQIRWREE